jgi:WhiB family transcriptional regulator, redox-sensing transcriptional regulator
MFRVPKRPAWWDDAACHDQLDLFFPKNGRTTQAARRLCADCPVLHDCDDWAMGEGPWLQGVFAGQTQADRNRRRKAAA